MDENRETATRKASELRPGDVVIAQDGSPMRIKSIGPSMIRGHRLVDFADGTWTHVRPSDAVEVAIYSTARKRTATATLEP